MINAHLRVLAFFVIASLFFLFFFCLLPVFFTLVDFYYGYSVQFGFILWFLNVSLYLVLQMFSFFSIIFIRSDGERFAKEWYGWPFGPKTKQNRHSRHLDENPVMFRWERCKKSLRRLGRKWRRQISSWEEDLKKKETKSNFDSVFGHFDCSLFLNNVYISRYQRAVGKNS